MTAALNPPIVGTPIEPAFLGVERSARGFRWVERLSPATASMALAISQRHGVPELLGRVLAGRGVDAHTFSAHFDPKLRDLLPDPASLQDITKAAERFAEAMLRSERIAIFGDYDVDGGASAALIRRFLAAHGQEATIYIPDRLTEGYGPSEAALSALAEEGATLILTVDCGTTSGRAIEAAAAKGVDVIVIDHHQADETLPPAFAIVNPNRQDDLSGQGHLAAAGVVFLFLIETLRALRQKQFYANGPAPDLLGLLDLVALATICDVVPLKGVNRAFVAQGLKVLATRHNPGLRALADVARLERAPNCYSLGFVLGPRINAGGRVGASSLGAELLATDDDIAARALAEKLEAMNMERRAIEARLLEEAIALAEQESGRGRPFLWACGDGWHKGLLGLVASRLTERFNLPAFATSWGADGYGIGSARSIAGTDLGRIIRAAVQDGILERGGGHALAAGFRLEKKREADWLSFLETHLTAPVAAAASSRRLAIDGALSARGATIEMLDLLDRAGPYGAAYPEPRFVLPAHRVQRLRAIGDKHLRCTLVAPDGGRVEACAFRVAETPLASLLADGEVLHVAGTLRRDNWNGRDSVEFLIEDAAAA